MRNSNKGAVAARIQIMEYEIMNKSLPDQDVDVVNIMGLNQVILCP